MSTLSASARFYAILDTGYVPRSRWFEMARSLRDGGADLIQVRAKQETAAEREALLQEILPLFDVSAPNDQTRPHLIINDDVDLCARTPGIGLHIGQEDMPPAEARRRIGLDRVLGLSTHSTAQARAAMALPREVLSYFCVGPLFATPTKPDYAPVGLDLVDQVVANRPPLPWFVIGGIKRGNLDQILAHGARRVVVVSEILQATDPTQAVRDFRQALSDH